MVVQLSRGPPQDVPDHLERGVGGARVADDPMTDEVRQAAEAPRGGASSPSAFAF
jgi:hypothetical protein